MNELTITLTGSRAQAYLDSLTTQPILTTEDVAKAEALDANYGQSIALTPEDDTSEELTDTTPEVIQPNPATFPASTDRPQAKPGSNWSDKELAAISSALDSNYTLAFLGMHLKGRSEASIRSMLLNYGIGVKKNKLYKR